MLKKLIPLVAVLAVGGTVAAAAVPNHDLTKAKTVTIHVALAKQAFRDLPPTGNSAGDLFVDRLKLKRNGHSAGYGHEACTATFPSSQSKMQLQCDEFLALKKEGQITAQGVLTLDFSRGGPQPTTFAITGGTGRYENVRGQIKTKSGAKGEVWTLHLLP